MILGVVEVISIARVHCCVCWVNWVIIDYIRAHILHWSPDVANVLIIFRFQCCGMPALQYI